MSSVFAATHDCRGCGACLATCPERALHPAPPAWDGPPLLTLVERCTGCGECMEICPADAFVEAVAA
jgi:ferredoxin